MARSISGLFLVSLGIAVAWLGTPADAALGPADVKCRKQIAIGVHDLVKALTKEEALCHQQRMLGKVLPGTNCSDPAEVPGAAKVQKATAKLADKTGKGCLGASTPQQNGYVLCEGPPECRQIGITDYTSVADCLACQTRDRILNEATAVFGTGLGPPTPPDATGALVSCQANVAKAAAKYFASRMKEQRKCQSAVDAGKLSLPPGADCKTHDAKGRIAKALAKMKLKIGKCSDIDFLNLIPLQAELHSCGTSVFSEQTCVQASVEANADVLFDDIFFPASGIFVSAKVGSPGSGTIADPTNSVTHAITLATQQGKPRIFIDNSPGNDYSEGTIHLQSGIQLLGGFNSLNSWVRELDPKGANFAHVLAGGTPSFTAVFCTDESDILIEQLKLVAPDATGVGKSSYGVRLDGCSAVTIRNSVIEAGRGSAGGSGGAGSGGASAPSAGGGGEQGADGGSGLFCDGDPQPDAGSGALFSCGGSSTRGGDGGLPNDCEHEDGTNGDDGLGVGHGQGGSVGARGCDGEIEGQAGGGGTPGGDGSNGSNGSGGASFGSVGSGYVPADGISGALGSHGAGGGGGGGGGGNQVPDGGAGSCSLYGGGGGGGGAGGCRGSAGQRGTGGGGSFGVWVVGGAGNTIVDSTIRVDRGGNGGAGGTGGAGGLGSPGGLGGTGIGGSGKGGNGGSGGNGGGGGHGGGGGGGPSIGILCSGSTVFRQGNLITFFYLGSASSGGSSPLGNDGANGLKAQEHGC